MTGVQVENIIVSFSVSSALDLSKLAEILPDAQYNPENAPAVILQFPHPHSMAALSSSGTVVVTGPKNMEEVHEVVKMVMDRLNVVGVECDESPELSMQNVTVSTDLRQEIKLRSLAKFLKIPEYSPRMFPGLVYKGEDPNTVILLFDSGKMVCNGKSVEEATVAIEKMVEKLVSFGIKMEENKCLK
ncbi:MAG: TATA-box-binding protein [Euryarchaeota archaeon]|nr:TATA-box-binding protein [Euryarchaeota archaeon]